MDRQANQSRLSHLRTEVQLTGAGFGHAPQIVESARGTQVVHDCANCAWLDERVDKDGTEQNLDNTFDAQKQLLIFDVSDDERRVEVKMTRRNGGPYLESRRPTEEELAAYLEVNPSMRTWTFAKIMTGTITCNKVSLRGQLHDALVHASSWGLDRLIRTRAIEGIEVVPLSGEYDIADHEIAAPRSVSTVASVV
jgi:hypothetical protein